MACKCALVDWSTTQSFLFVPGVGLWEEMVIPHRIDPNHCTITQQSEGGIEHALRLQNKCELCSNTDMKHPRKWLKRRNIVRRTIGLEEENKPRLTKSQPQVPSNPASSALPLGQKGVGTLSIPFSFCSAIPPLLPLCPPTVAVLGHRSDHGEEPSAHLGTSLSWTLKGSSEISHGSQAGMLRSHPRAGNLFNRAGSSQDGASTFCLLSSPDTASEEGGAAPRNSVKLQ